MKQLFRIAAVCCLVSICLALLATPARADWHSLSGLLPEHTTALRYKISPDSRYVVYVADVDTDDTDELYIVPIEGGTPRKLNPALPAGGDVLPFSMTFSLDSQYLFYIADQEVDNRNELYRVPVTGGQPSKINAPLISGGNVIGFLLDPDSTRVIYLADQQTNEVLELWSIVATGGGLVKLNGELAAGGDVTTYDIDTTGNRVVYLADQLLDERSELWSAPIAGGMSVRLNPELAANADVSSFEINRIINVVVFEARESGAATANLWVIPTAGGVALSKLNFNLPANDRIIGYRISPFGDKVVFNVATSNDIGNRGYSFVGNLYSTLIGGGVGSVNLTETAEPYFGVDLFRFTPNGSHVVYRYQKNATSPQRFESSTVAGGVRGTLYEPSGSDPPLFSFTISSDSAWVAYTTGSTLDSRRLSTVPIGGGSSTNFGPGNNPLITPDNGRVVYNRNTGAQNKNDLFSAQIFGGDGRDLSGMQGGGYIGDTAVSGDGEWIVFVVQINNRYELRVSDGSAAQPPATPTVTGQPTPTPSNPGQPTGHRTLLPLAQR